MTWLERLEAAKKRGKFTLEDRVDASLWKCCAVGEHEHLKEGSGWLREDLVLDPVARYGLHFSWAVLADDIADAEDLYWKIQDRALTIKREGA